MWNFVVSLTGSIPYLNPQNLFLGPAEIDRGRPWWELQLIFMKYEIKDV